MKYKTVPNLITLLRFILFFGVLASLFSSNDGIRIVGFGLYLLVFGMDKLDGYVARKYNQVSDLGKFFDLSVDRIIVTSMLVVYLYNFPQRTILLMILINLTRDFMVAGIRQLAAYKGLFLKAHITGKFKFICENTVVIMMLGLMSIPGIKTISGQVITATNVVLGLSTILGLWGLGLYLKQVFQVKD